MFSVSKARPVFSMGLTVCVGGGGGGGGGDMYASSLIRSKYYSCGISTGTGYYSMYRKSKVCSLVWFIYVHKIPEIEIRSYYNGVNYHL